MYPIRPTDRVDARFLYYEMLSDGFSQTRFSNLRAWRCRRLIVSRSANASSCTQTSRARQIVAYLHSRVGHRCFGSRQAASKRHTGFCEGEPLATAVTKGIRGSAAMRNVDREWITEIPAHWNVCALKRILSRVDYGISDSTETEGRYPVLKMAHSARRDQFPRPRLRQ